MENTQDFLNLLTITLILTFAALITFDFFNSLVGLWNQPGKAIYPLPRKLETEKTNTLPYLKPVSKVVWVNYQQADYITSNTANNVDIESLKLLIQQLAQPQIRTAARRLGIADKVDGKYQKLGILRTQLQAKLKSQPQEAAQILSKVKMQTSKKTASSNTYVVRG
jgi:hypothetical protein